MGAGCSWSLRGEVDMKMFDNDNDEVSYDDKGVKYSKEDDKVDEVSRVVNEEINSTVSNRLK